MASKATATSAAPAQKATAARAGTTARKSNKIYCYIGPNIRGYWHTGQIFRGERDSILRENAELVEKHPLVKALLVPGGSLASARLKVKKPGTGHYANYQRLQKELREEFHYSAYAACFSKYRDDAAQWDRYGHSGQGVCIAFHEYLLHKMIGGAVSLQKVYYQKDMRSHRLVNEFYALIKESNNFSENLPQMQDLMNDAWVQSAAYKHPSFASEREFRLVVSPFITNEFAIEPKYHVSSERIKKYYPLDLNRMCGKLDMRLSDLVGEIIIGPTSPQSLPILQDYLADCGLNILRDRVHLSECPLRNPTT